MFRIIKYFNKKIYKNSNFDYKLNSKGYCSVGGKTKGLDKLIDFGFNVPKYVSIPYKYSLEGINKIVTRNFPNYQNMRFAVRSSAFNEDSKTKSCAGQYYTALGVPYANIYEEVTNVKKSYKSQEGSVIIQEFIPSTKGGVTFTDAGQRITIINSNFGLCDTVVKGEPCDQFYVLENGMIVKKVIHMNKNPVYFNTNSNTFETKKNVKDISLTNDEIVKLLNIAKDVQSKFNEPQDIEWCMINKEEKGNDKLYLLQSRPITKPIIKTATYYDGANIQESFPGIVLPMTYTMTLYGYAKIYYNALRQIGIRKKILDERMNIFNDLLYSCQGRIYYNMNNWNSMTKFLPHKQGKNFQNMITSNFTGCKFDSTIDGMITVIPRLSKIKFYIGFVWNYILLQPRINKLTSLANNKFDKFRTKPNFLKDLKLKECINLLQEYQDEILSRWYLIGINDFFVAHYYHYFYQKYGIDRLKNIFNFETISTRQITDLVNIVNSFTEDLWKAVEKRNKMKFDFELNLNPIIKFKLDKYFETFQGRFGNELKLETPDLYNDFDKFSKLLISYKNYRSDKSNFKSFKSNFNKNSNIKLTFVGKILLKYFKKHATNRENLRLIRSNFFGIIRKIVKRIGEILYEQERIDDPDDIFYLNFDVMMNSTEKYEKYQKYVEEVKKKYNIYKTQDPPSYFVSINSDNNNFTDNFNNNGFNGNNNLSELKGIGCSEGKIIGKIKLFHEPEITEEEFDILVAKNTDPGWTTLIGKAKGMIIESGGILSHAAIVSRELGIPTIIGIPNLMKILKDGQIIELDGTTGIIKIK